MKAYLEKIIQSEKPGLYICQLPTGFGKTYQVSECIKDFVLKSRMKRKIIYLTTMNKNLPEQTLQKLFGEEKEKYKENILRIRANFDEVEEKILNIQVPDEFQTATYSELYELIKIYHRIQESKISDKQYIEDIINRINIAEKQFRKEISKYLNKRYKGKQEKLAAITYSSDCKWIGELYPAVFTDTHQVLLMSISKFLKRNSTLIEPSYEFLKADWLENSIIFIDEFDATKLNIQNEIIENSLALKEDYLRLFRHIHRTLNYNDMSEPFRMACNIVEQKGRYSLEKIIDEGKEISNKYKVNLSFKTIESEIDRKQNFLLKDGSFHSILQKGERYIRVAENISDNRVEIFFENKEDFFANHKSTDIIIYSMLRDIHSYLVHFRYFLYEWADAYMQYINSMRSSKRDAMTIDNAIHTILAKLEMSSSQRNFLLGELCVNRIAYTKDELLPDRTFYQTGMELFEFEDNDQHYDYTNLQFVEVFDTPEKILIYLAQKATLFGISATADIPTVVGNYNLSYIAERLEDSYHPMNHELKERIREKLVRQWDPYKNGKVKVHTEIIRTTTDGFDVEDACRSILDDTEIALVCNSYITATATNSYFAKRYCNILYAMKSFCKLENIQSMLYLGMSLPKINNPDMDEILLNTLMEMAKNDTSRESLNHISLFVLKGDNFEESKKQLIEKLRLGEKVFVISSYNTIGAGQNLQYGVDDKTKYVELVPETNGRDERNHAKDFDAIYLADITNLTVNTYEDGKITATALLEMLFQIEELYQNGELNYQEMNDMIKLAFQSYSKKSIYQHNLLYNTRSVRMQVNQKVLQAVGRMCRTYIKNSDIYLFIEEKLLDKLEVEQLNRCIIPPEMEALVELKEELGVHYSQEDKYVLNNAERISAYGMWTIRQMLSKNWTSYSMHLWEELRKTVLSFPTADKELWMNNEIVHKLFITSGKLQNRYLFSQYSDFTDVTIDFGNDRLAFKNSGRAKKEGELDEVVIYEMNEEETRLPVILKYPGMRRHFQECGYATEFCLNEYMMSPVLYHNIYKGALGEVAGEFILRKERGIHLRRIEEPEVFEFFDYEMADGVYVDFKNWKFSYAQDREKSIEEIKNKLNSIGGKRVYIINVVLQTEAVPSTCEDESIIEIPGIIDKHGNCIYNGLNMIKEEDYL